MRLVAREDTPGQWAKATTEYERIIAKGATQAMRKIGKLAVDAGRRAIGAAGFTANVQRTLRAINKPKQGFVLNPSVYIHSTVNYLDVFETGKTITGHPWLWLPLPNVPPNPGSGTKFGGLIGRPHMTPRQYVAKVGPLVTMHRPGKPPMLGAVVETGGRPTRRRLRSTFLKQRFGESTRRTIVVPMFVGVSSITIGKKFDVTQAIASVAPELSAAYKELVEPYEGRR